MVKKFKVNYSLSYDQDKKSMKRVSVHFLEDGQININLRENDGEYVSRDGVFLDKKLAIALAKDILKNAEEDAKAREKLIIIELRDGTIYENDPKLGLNLNSIENIKKRLKDEYMYNLYIEEKGFIPILKSEVKDIRVK